MKIVQILPELNEGGVERGAIELSSELVKSGFESIIISHGGKLTEQIEQNGALHVKLDVCSKNPLSAPWRVWNLYKTLKKINPDIIHVRSRVPAWMVFFANKWLKKPVVASVHGLNSVNAYSKIMTKFDHTICVSSVVKEYIIKGYNIKNSKNISVIERGVDVNKFNLENIDSDFVKKFKNKYNLKNKFIITSVGRITWLKDYETFIKSIALIKKNYPQVIALVVGGVREDKKEYFQSLKDLAETLNVSNEVIFTGSQTKMPEIYALSNVLINASLKMGNVARTITESLAMNTPVIATTYEGLDNIIKDGQNGYVIQTQNPADLAKKIELCIDTPLHNVRETLNKSFTLEVLVRDNIKIYKKLKDES